jgi:hypothetical protein
MDRRHDYSGPSPPSLLSGAAHVHRVHPVGDVITGELPQWFRRLIEVGKSLLAPWQL